MTSVKARAKIYSILAKRQSNLAITTQHEIPLAEAQMLRLAYIFGYLKPNGELNDQDA